MKMLHIENKKSCVFIVVFIYGIFFSTNTIGQSVNEFTGGYSTSVPLISIPSPYGPAISISAIYGSGVGVNQSSSEIGLGWGINSGGVISRNVSGIPDDWNGAVVSDPTLGGFKSQGGVLFFKNGTSHQNLDFYKSTYKIDTPFFCFPDYDFYSVNAPGISGVLNPHLFDFATTELNIPNTGGGTPPPPTPYTLLERHPFSATMKFNYSDDYGGDLKSRHYPTSPINGSTTLRLPGSKISDLESSYSADSTPYVGVNNIGFNPTTNRLATAKYVDYSYDESNGITGFTIFDESGYKYVFNQSVKINYVVSGKFPLNNDYSVKSLDTTRVTDGNGNYYIKENTLSDANNPFMVEWKQNSPYTYNWLLKEITGPDYVDVNSNQVADIGDKGYWVSYDWKLWTDNFTRRTPECGFDYSFTGDEGEKTRDYDTASSIKVHGKFGTFSKFNQELYYLNKIQTSSHTAVFVRDVRLDNYGSDNYYYDNQSNSTFNINNVDGQTKTSLYGTLYDSGGPNANYTSSTNYTVTIAPTGSPSSITVRFTQFNMTAGDYVKIMDNSNNELVTYSSTNLPPTNGAKFDFNTIKIQQYSSSGGAKGFRLGWTASIHHTVVPQLKLTRIILFNNEDFGTLNLPSSSSNYHVSSNVVGFDVSSVGKNNFYNETWYNHADNKTAIESKSLQTIEFSQDYSLARKYSNNIKTFVCATDKLSPNWDVVKGTYTASADYSNSGKLTLNEINSFGVGHLKVIPSIIFDYNENVADDNPDYNPVKVDYWGFYKSDATEKGYSSYTTSTSKDYTDAWCLRKITSPMGGTTEITYESNQYEKVFDGENSVRGPSKIYSIKSVSVDDPGISWNYELDEGSATLSDFNDLKNSAPSGTTKSVLISFIEPGLNTKYQNFGTFSFASPSKISSIASLYMAYPVASNDYYSVDPSVFTGTLTYTGSGYINFQLPVGTAVYGGGTRVKSLVVKNGEKDTYTKEYSYYEGVTPMEADRFGEKQLVVDGGIQYYMKLRSAVYDKHKMGPGIGYSKVVVKDKGQDGISNGSVVSSFFTSDANLNNYNANVQQRITNDAEHPETPFSVCTETNLSDTSYIVEVIDNFSGHWGNIIETKFLDKNDNILSKMVNEYSAVTQGTIVEKYAFLTKRKHSYPLGDDFSVCAEYHYVVCILRDVPTVLTKQTTYQQEISSITEFLSFDPITKIPTMIRTTTPNKGITVSRSVPAFRISEYAAMGPKSVTSTNANVVSALAYTKTTVDSTITSSSDFIDYSVQTYKKNLNIRTYDNTNNKFINDLQNDVYWTQDRSYSWAGVAGSIDDYGLYKQSELTSAPFDYTLSSIDSKWRFDSENTLFDKSGHILEVKGFNNRYGAKKYGYGDSLLIAEAMNTNFASFTFSSFESAVKDMDVSAGVANYIDGEIKINNGVKISGTPSIPAHTGNYLIKVPSGTTGSNSPTYSTKFISSSPYSGLLKGRTYRASVWVHGDSNSDCRLSASLAGGTPVSISLANSSISAGSWSMLNIDISVGSSLSDGDELKVYLESPSGDAYFDDFRLHPVEATLISNVYEPKTNRVIATLDEKNFATKYKYDAGGRVLEVWKEIENVGLKRLKKYKYNYSRGLN